MFLCLTWKLIYCYIDNPVIGIVPNSYSCLTAQKTHIPKWASCLYIWKNRFFFWELEQNTALCGSITRTIETYCIFLLWKGGWELLVNKLRLADSRKGSLSTHIKQNHIECLAKDARNIRYIEAYTKSEECRIAALYELQDVPKVPYNHEEQT